MDREGSRVKYQGVSPDASPWAGRLMSRARPSKQRIGVVSPQLKCKKGPEGGANQVEGVSGLGCPGTKELWKEAAVAEPRPKPASGLIPAQNAQALSKETPGFNLMGPHKC